MRRCAVRIVDADCGAGTLLLHALAHARSLGFTAIEGRGIGGSPALIGRARAAATRLANPAIGLTFELADMVVALEEEGDAPADIVLWHRPAVGRDHRQLAQALARAGEAVIGDEVAHLDRGSRR